MSFSVDSRVRFNPEPGARFGRLVVVDTSLRTAPARPGHVGKRRFVCRCDCGSAVTLDPAQLGGGGTRSCGCLRRDKGVDRGIASRRHGQWGHQLYKTWSSMIRRCLNSADRAYERYGGRGIKIHSAWVGDPAEFILWIDTHLGVRPDGYSLDRIDNDGNYEPGNLRWADNITQNNNRRPARRTRWDACSK